MRNIIKLMFLVIILLFFMIGYMLINNNKYANDILNNIIKNTDLDNIEYVNKYDNYYIVLDDECLYVFDDEYKEVAQVSRMLLADNKNNYDIIYKDERLMYFSDALVGKKIVYTYYDLYSYQLVDSIEVGESYE